MTPNEGLQSNETINRRDIVQPSTAVSVSSPARSAGDSYSPSAFACTQCPRSFTRRENLSRHEKTHSAPEAHRCAVCGKGFARSDLLSRHAASHTRLDETMSNISNKRRKISKDTDTKSKVSSAVHEHINPLQMSGSSASSSTHYHPDIVPRSMLGQPNTSASTIQPMDPLMHPHGRDNIPLDFASGGSDFIATSERHTPSPYASSFHPQLHFQDMASHPNHSDGFASSNADLMSMNLSSFFMPNTQGENDDLPLEWFSHDFYSAIQETGNETFGFMPVEPASLPSISSLYQNLPHSANSYPITREQSSSTTEHTSTSVEADMSDVHNHRNKPIMENVYQDRGRVSRMPSPPNVASEEDKWAFAWDPSSAAILSADPIHVPFEHPLRNQHSTRFDITHQTYAMARKALVSTTEGRSSHSFLTFPTLDEANVFIGLFFEHFSHKMPVLHHSTLDTNVDLPPPLLGAIIVIGAIYSQLRGTRRFAIVLLDVVRWHLEVAIEHDNRLMRDPKIIFAETLVCYAGLWCGNKRAFELAEVLRATVVKHVRGARFWKDDGQAPRHDRSAPLSSHTLTARWHQWIRQESGRRLFWVVYALDMQFPGLLYLPGMFSIGEFGNMCCPCDEEFWTASSARHWRDLLGPALIPPSRLFSAAAAPFLRLPSISAAGEQVKQRIMSVPVLALNDWSAFLILTLLQNQIFQFSQECLFWDTYHVDDDEENNNVDISQHDVGVNVLALYQCETGSKPWQNLRRQQFERTLTIWKNAYLLESTTGKRHATPSYFYRSSTTCHVMAMIILNVPFTAVQDAIGKNGRSGIAPAKRMLQCWITTQSKLVEDTVSVAIKTINDLVTQEIGIGASEHSIIATFLSYVLIWIFANGASSTQKHALIRQLENDGQSWKHARLAHVKKGLLCNANLETASAHSMHPDSDASRYILGSAAACLTQLGTWGAALNLALLLQRRSEMRESV